MTCCAGHAAGNSRVSPALANLADAHQELGAHVGGVAGRVGRAEHQQPERRAFGLDAQRHHRDRHHAGRLVEPAHRLEAGVQPAVRQREARREALARRRSRRWRTAARANASAAPQTRMPACGIRNSRFSSATSTAGRSSGARGQHDRSRPAMQPVGDRHVVLAVADHLDDPVLEALDLLAQHFHLPLLQRHRALAVRAGQLDRREQLGMALEEAGRVGQVVGDVVFGDAR